MKAITVALGVFVVAGIVWVLFPQLNPPRATTLASPASLPSAPPVSPRTQVAWVNTVPVTAGELDEEFDRLLPPTNAHGGADPGKKKQLRKAALEQLIARELAYQKAKAMGLQVEPDALAAMIEKIKGRYTTEQSFQEALRAEDINEQEFVHRVEKDLLQRQIFKLRIEDKAAVSDAEVKQYYEQNKPKFLRPESIRLRHIVIKATPEDGARAEKKIQEVFDKLQAGEPFESVAYRYSEDDYRVLGGDYGSVHRGQLAPDLEKAAFTAELRTLTGPLQTSWGWHLLRVEDHQPARQLKFEEARENIANRLRQKRLQQRKAEFVQDLKAGASIEYLISP